MAATSEVRAGESACSLMVPNILVARCPKQGTAMVATKKLQKMVIFCNPKLPLEVTFNLAEH